MQNLHISAPLEEKLLTGSLRPPSKLHHKKNRLQMRTTHGVSRKPGGNNRQERKDAVSSREDGNRGAGSTLARQQDRTERRPSAFGGKPQCVVEQRKSSGSYRLANVTTLPTANVEVTRTRWHGQHAIVVATEKVHPGWQNGKGRDCHAEQLVSTLYDPRGR